MIDALERLSDVSPAFSVKAEAPIASGLSNVLFTFTFSATADLLKRHAERHNKREQSGLHSQPTPGRIKGSTKKKPLLASAEGWSTPAFQGGASASTSGGEYLSSGPNSAPNSVTSHATPLPSPPIVDDYDHTSKFADMYVRRAWQWKLIFCRNLQDIPTCWHLVCSKDLRRLNHRHTCYSTSLT